MNLPNERPASEVPEGPLAWNRTVMLVFLNGIMCTGYFSRAENSWYYYSPENTRHLLPKDTKHTWCELSDVLQPEPESTDPISVSELLSSRDAMVWAKAFNQQFPTVSVDDAIGWFANAMGMGSSPKGQPDPMESRGYLLPEGVLPISCFTEDHFYEDMVCYILVSKENVRTRLFDLKLQCWKYEDIVQDSSMWVGFYEPRPLERVEE